MNPVADRAGEIPGPAALVLGAGASGVAATRFLRRLGRRVLVADSGPESGIADAPELRSLGAELRGGGHPPALLEGMALVVASPGVPPRAAIVRAARRKGIPLWGELELGYRALGEPWERIVAVTGTKGKSSVVTLLAEALRRGGIPASACGNLGTPLSAFAGDFGPEQVAVVEASSFQLATISRFRARVGVMLAVAEDHLDWHPDSTNYRRSKARLFENQQAGDWAVFDGADPVASRAATAAARKNGAALLPFAGHPGYPGPEVVIERGFVVRRESGERHCLAAVSSLGTTGAHQHRNLAAAAAAASVLGVGRGAIEAAAQGFTGLPHALSELESVGGVRFVNDSRATSLTATGAALDAIAENSPAPAIHLILGGILKGGRFRDLEPRLGPVARIWAIGESRRRIAAEIRSVPLTTCESLDEAVRGAFAAARPAGVVLLSPGCSSFDMFDNYRDRGKRFAAAVARLAAEEGEAGP